VIWKKSTCLQCPAGCGIQVKTIRGNAVKIEGNPEHPLNRGRLCPKGQAGLQVLYDPDRIKGPMKQVGKRGAGKWQSVSWEEAIGEVALRLAAIRRQDGPHTVVIMGGRYRGRMRELVHRFAQSYGTPNEIDASSIGSGNSKLAHYLTQGVYDYLAYDWENTNYVISFGASLIEAFRPTVMVQRMFAHLRQGRPGRRAKIVMVDPRFSVTASKADEWIPIRPGTDGALALGMAHVIVRENLYDQHFIRGHTFGFTAWKEWILDAYSLEAASRETGIPSDAIARLAREFAQRGPAIAVAGRGAGMHTNGLYNLMAIHCLNALVGNIDAPGGVLVQEGPAVSTWPQLELDAAARRGLSMPRLDGAGSARFPLAESVSSALPEAIISERPYKTNAVFLYYTNPLFSAPHPQRFRAALERVPLVVSFSPFMDETTAVADFVLPDHTYLERWQDDVPPPSVGYPVLSVRQPVVQPLYNTMDTGDVLIGIAKAMGEPVAAALPWENYQAAMRSGLKGTAASVSVNADTFWEQLLENGVWSNGPYEFGRWQRVFKTPSGRFEFLSSLMQERLAAVASREGMSVDQLAARLGIEARGDKVFMAHYERPRSVTSEKPFSLYLNSYKTMMHAEGRGANQPWLQESFGVQLNEFWGPWIEINPDTAARYGIKDGDRVRLDSPLGQVDAKARLFEGVMPDMVNMPYEYGHVGGGRWVIGSDENPNAIMEKVYDHLSGVVSRSATKVTIRKV
jgi:anaerobic selenocysteine-containing dehydrogenase